MNKKVLALGVSVVLVVAIILSVVYFETRDTYTIIGTLRYRPAGVFPGISAENITPNVSPEPSNITVTEWHGTNVTVTSFVYLYFPKTSTLGVNFRPNPPFFPIGLGEHQNVTVSGKMSYVDYRHAYVMNVTSISLHSP
jgi:hypothetical protein